MEPVAAEKIGGDMHGICQLIQSWQAMPQYGEEIGWEWRIYDKNKEKNKKTAFRKQDSGNPDDYAYDDRLSPVFRLSDYLGASVVIF